MDKQGQTEIITGESQLKNLRLIFLNQYLLCAYSKTRDGGIGRWVAGWQLGFHAVYTERITPKRETAVADVSFTLGLGYPFPYCTSGGCGANI